MKSHLVTAIISAATAVGAVQVVPQRIERLEVDQLIVRQRLVVSDTGEPWEAGFEDQMVARGLVARAGGPGEAGLWVRGRLIQSEVDDPFDQRFQSVNSNGQLHRAPGHISWNCWLDGAWRQMAIVQGEGLEENETPVATWSGDNHPGRLRFQSFRPDHPEPLTDVVMGQGKMSVGGGGFGGGGLPYPSDVIEVWGGRLKSHGLDRPVAPVVLSDDGRGEHRYAIVGVGPQGDRSPASEATAAGGHASLRWDSLAGADEYVVYCDGEQIAGPLRIEGSQKNWTDPRTGQ